MARGCVLGLVAAALLLGACAEEDSGSESGEAAKTQAEQPQAEKEPKPKANAKPKAQPASAEECLKGLGFTVERRDSNLVRATPEGEAGFININEFPTEAEAKAFDAQLQVPGEHFYVGKKVGVGFADGEAGDVRSVENCVRAEQQR